MFQPNTNGYLITTAETVLLTGKRNPPIWLILFTLLALMVVLTGGILLLLFYNASVEPAHKMDTFFGILALLVSTLFPTMLVARYYLQLENLITIHREGILAVECDGAHLTLLAQTALRKQPVRFILLTRAAEEALTIERNLCVRANGRLRVYPITFQHEKRLLTTLAQTEIRLVAKE